MTPASNGQGEGAEAVARAIADRCLAALGHRARGFVFTKQDLKDVERLVSKYSKAVAENKVDRIANWHARNNDACRDDSAEIRLTKENAALRSELANKQLAHDATRKAYESCYAKLMSAEATVAELRAKASLPPPHASTQPEQAV